jgi:hypothetical protein
VGILRQTETTDDRFNETEATFAWGSLVRCGFAKKIKGEWKTSGNLLSTAARHSRATQILRNCSERYLASLPPSVRLVLMLGNEKSYIKTCHGLMQRLYPPVRWLNDVAYFASPVTWVHLANPSPGNGHVNAFCNGDSLVSTNPQVLKRELAARTIANVNWD